MRSVFNRFALGAIACGLVAFVAIGASVRADSDDHKKNAPNPIGAWFGIARPCPANAQTDSPTHADFCKAVCDLCPNAGILPPEVPMMPTLLADGTVLADDAGEISLYHTTAHGKWMVSEKDGLPDLPGTTRYRATFFWLGQNGPTGILGNGVRPRFVTYFDPSDPDRMIGYIQPYFFPIAAQNGTVIVNPYNPLDPLAGNHIPTIDPLVSPLPDGCQLDKGCLGTYHFVIRRVKAK
jgi:hypothetical protein